MKEIEVIMYPVGLIDPSPYQSRKKFDAVKLAELAGSVKEDGIIQPLTARVSPRDVSRLELVAGERRLRAAKMAELETVPVIVHEMSDRRAHRIVLIENLQREDLTVSEEAQGYENALSLLDEEGKPVYTQASLATEINKPLNHVRDRLKLLMCPPELIAAVEEGTVSLSTAMLVGRVPEAKARVAVATLVLKPDIQEVPLNYKQTQEMIRERFMVSLQRPGFDIEAADLLPVVMSDTGERLMGGSCVGCPFVYDASDRTRNSASGQGGGGEISQTTVMQLCTLPSCFKKKQDAAWKVVARTAEAQGVRVIQGDGARELFRSHGHGLNHDAPYIVVDEKPGYDDVGYELYNKNNKTWRKLLKGTDVEIVIARHPVTGQRVELVEKKTARVIVKAKLKGTDAAAEIKSTEDAEAVRKGQRSEELRALKIEVLVVNEGLTDVVAAIERKGMGLDELDFLFVMTLEQSGADGVASMGKWLEVAKPAKIVSGRDYLDGVLKAVRARATTVNAWMGFITAAVLCKHIKYSGSSGEDFTKLKTLYGIKDVELKRRAAAILDVGKKAKKVESAPSQTQAEKEAASTDYYHCDCCGKVCALEGTSITTLQLKSELEHLPEGGFICAACPNPTELNGYCQLPPLRPELQAEFETWVPKKVASGPSRTEILTGVQDTKQGRGMFGRGPIMAAAERASVVGLAEKPAAEMTFDEQVRALVAGTHKMADIIGKTPKKDALERKAWDAKRVKLTKAVAKAA